VRFRIGSDRVYELVILVVVGTSIWVAFDAPAHGMSWAWGIGCLLLWIIVFPGYLWERRSAPKLTKQGRQPAAETDLQRLQRMRAEGQLNAAQYEAEKRQLAKRLRQ
jgi:hypothetical protein